MSTKPKKFFRNIHLKNLPAVLRFWLTVGRISAEITLRVHIFFTILRVIIPIAVKQRDGNQRTGGGFMYHKEDVIMNLILK